MKTQWSSNVGRLVTAIAYVAVFSGDPPSTDSLAHAEVGSSAASTDVEHLIRRLKDPDRWAREQAVEALGKTNDRRVIPALQDALKDEAPRVRRDAVEALAGFNDHRVPAALNEALRDEDQDVRRTAVRKLVLFVQRFGQLKEPDGYTALIERLRDPVSDVRTLASSAIGELKVGSAVPALIKVLNDKKSDIRRDTAISLGEIRDATAVPALVGALKDRDWDLRKHAALALRWFKDQRSVPALAGALKDRKVDVRLCAGLALAELRDTRAVPVLLQALDMSDPGNVADVRKEAVFSLGRIGRRDKRVLPTLLRIAQEDPDGGVQLQAAGALEYMEKELRENSDVLPGE